MESSIDNLALGWLGGGFAAFVLYCRFAGIFARDGYYAVVAKVHAVFCALTMAGFVGQCYFGIPSHAALHWLVFRKSAALEIAAHALAIGILFFLVHYGLFHPLIGLVKRSVSLNLMLLLRAYPGKTVAELGAMYADGRGMQFLVDSRIGQMRALGWIEGEASFHLTTKGRRTAWWYRLLKEFFGLKTPFEKVSR